MTKRLLALFLVCILAIPIVAVPASALTVDGITYDSYGTYLQQVTFNVLEDVYRQVQTVNTWLDGIDGWCDTLWQEIRNQRIWQETTLGSALDTINNNLISFNSNVDLWIEAQTVAISSWLEAQFNLFDAFVTEGFFAFWEDWADKIADFKSSVNSGFGMLQSYITSIQSQIQGLAQGTQTHRNEATEMETEAATQATEFQENMEVIDEWTRPDYEADFDPSVDEITGGEDISLYSDGLGYVLGETTIFPVLLFMAFSFSTISFVVFGKR